MGSVAGKRNEKIDILKGLAIIYVVIGHSGAPFAIITSFFQPMFFYIAGYLYKEDYTFKPLVMVKKRLKSLYIPFIKYGLFFGILHNVLFKINIYTEEIQSHYNKVSYFNTPQEFIINLLKILSFAKVEQILAPMWFVPVLFIVNMLFLFTSYGVYKLRPNNRELWLPIALSAMFCIGFLYPLQNNLILRPISIGMVATITYYYGYLYRKYEAKINVNGFYAFAAFIVLLISLPYGPEDTGGHRFISPPFYLMISLCSLYISTYLATVFGRLAVLKNFLILAGQNTLEIMALHFFAFRAINYLQVQIYHLPPYMLGKHPTINTSGGWWAVYIGAGLILPMVANYLYERIKAALRPKEQPSPI